MHNHYTAKKKSIDKAQIFIFRLEKHLESMDFHLPSIPSEINRKKYCRAEEISPATD